MEQTNSSLFDLQIDPYISRHLGETARWSKFLSIVGFVGCGLIIICSFFLATAVTANMGGSVAENTGYAIGVMCGYIFFALLWFFPCFFLFRFSTRMQVALRNNDQETLTRSFQSLKACFKFIGILTIITLALWAIGILISLASLGASI